LRGCLHITKPIEQCVHHSYAAVDKLVLTLVAPVAAILHCGSLISACTDLLVFIDVIKCIFSHLLQHPVQQCNTCNEILRFTLDLSLGEL